MSNRVYHPECNKSWSNNDTVGHCAACCETFYGLRAFDQHRRGGVCTFPVPSEGGFWVDELGRWHWGTRMDAEAKARVIPIEDS